MYSFLVTSNVGAWDSRTYEYRRERFCQYTEDVIKQQFWTLTAEAIVQLQAFPVLFAYEGTTADVRVGYIRRVVDRRDRDTVFIEFDFEYRFPPIPFAQIEPLRVALDLGNKWELGTTHWAIKNADLFRILTTAGLVQAGVGGSPLPASTNAATVPSRGATLAREAELDLLVAALRRLGSGALRPLISRRRNRPGIAMNDEYDAQDAVEGLLRALYMDVRAEEPTPSSAGSSSRMDMQVRSQRLAVEVKVTAPGRSESAIKQEVLRDIHDYQSHPNVETLVVVVYDFAATFSNPAGFESDLSGRHNNVTVVVVVAAWVGPRV